MKDEARRWALGLLGAVLAFGAAAGEPLAALKTQAEQSGYARTGRYEEVERLCTAFAKAYPRDVRCESFGTTPEGRAMRLLVVNTAGVHTPKLALARQLPVTLVQAGIHAGEIDGKDATFALLREWLADPAKRALLAKQVLLFVPVFSVDGHERFGPNHRPNQRGPEEMGWRVTAQNLNLNRDYLKADAPEMRAMHALNARWDPLAVIDLHVTDGAQFEHDVSIQVEPVHAGDERLRPIGKALRDGVIADITAQGSLPQPFYMSFEQDDDPASGFADGVAPPRFSTGYYWLRNRLGMLVELHSWKRYPERVRVMRNIVASVLKHVAEHGVLWQREALAADARAKALKGQPMALAFAATDEARLIDFRGYAYTREPSSVSGALMTRYDESKPQIWRVPLRDVVKPSLEVKAPQAGYIVAAAHAQWAAAELALHGVAFQTLKAPWREAPTQTFRASKVQMDARSTEGRQRVRLDGAWKAEPRSVGAGSLYVPIAQAKARVVAALLEPQAPDAWAAWGRFNAHFESKEYMEGYVAEAEARRMMQENPALKAEFDAKLKADEAFAKDPWARLNFFYQRHPAYDERLNLYPVYRVDVPPPGAR